MTQKAMMISIRPIYAEKIFNGTKCVELRRVKPNLNSGDVVVVYVTSPIKQVWGKFIVSRVIQKPTRQLWDLVQFSAGITKSEFDKYFQGISDGYGIFLQSASLNKSYISLDEIRKNWIGFHPPQSYRYLSTQEIGLFS
jgi:predicted transcriptional regulator